MQSNGGVRFVALFLILLSFGCGSFADGARAAPSTDAFEECDLKTFTDIECELAFNDARFEPAEKIKSLRPFTDPVGRLIFEIKTPNGKLQVDYCSGFLVSRNLIITARHCAMHAAGQVLRGLVTFGYWRFKTGEDFQVLRTVEAGRTLDFAILEVSGSPGDKFGVIKLDVRDPSPLEREQLYLVHHPVGHSKKVTRFNCMVVAKPILGNAFFGHSCDSLPGSSGGPLFADVDNKLVGLHVNTQVKPRLLYEPMLLSNTAVRMTNVVRESAILRSLQEDQRARALASDHQASRLVDADYASPDLYDELDVFRKLDPTNESVFKKPKARVGGEETEFETLNDFAEQSRQKILSRAVGRLEIKYRRVADGKLGAGWCTAWLIDEKHVMTNYHCIPGAHYPDWIAAEARIRLNYYHPEQNDTKIFYLDGTPTQPVSPLRANEELDYSVSVLKTPAVGFATIDISNYRESNDAERLYIITHPFAYYKLLSWTRCHASAKAVIGNVLRHDCDTKGGSSGSPVFATDDKLVGLHSAGWAFGNAAFTMRSIVEDLKVSGTFRLLGRPKGSH